ncbi:hypothetical protein [Porphyromonas sp. COT-239 OH1446]|uniref:hypothetical protein n=1 Tax=Porphyromonas sp. COT-239 OH1446 TaxID=1515613 RepID=UPI00052CD0B8|nr:hypothetical protein [Porphyromonas sp. COT-239 OH1446]KGN70145.1 hypothetical protein HQ37_03595 [Porphyromonas sp. COT-239 OH1446]
MKRLILLGLLYAVCTGNMKAQTPVDTLKTSDGKKVVLMSDQTWHFVGERTKSQKERIKPQKTKKNKTYRRDNQQYSSSSYCGAPTKKGGACRRRVRGGGYCWQHR